MPVTCNNCGEEWPRDPVLEVECPTCSADVGEKCSRPSGHSGNFVHPHASRDKRAAQEHGCQCTEGDDSESEPEQEQDDGTTQLKLSSI